MPEDPRGWNCWTYRDATTPSCLTDAEAKAASNVAVMYSFGQTFGYRRYMWKGVIYPTDPSLATAGRVDTVTIRVPVPGPAVHDTIPVIVPGRVDTVTVVGSVQGAIQADPAGWLCWHRPSQAHAAGVPQICVPDDSAYTVSLGEPLEAYGRSGAGRLWMYQGKLYDHNPLGGSNLPELPRASVDTSMPPSPGTTIPVSPL